MSTESTQASVAVNESSTTFKSLNAQKKEYEGLWRMIYFVITVISAIILQKVYIFQTEQTYENVRKGSIYDILFFSFPFSIFFVAMDRVTHYLLDQYYLDHVLTDQKYQGNARPKRVNTLVKWTYSLVYYLISSTAAFLLLKNTTFFPTWLGGSGSPTENYYIHFTTEQGFYEATFAIKIFYTIQFGKHFARCMIHLFIQPDGNYYQYALHHVLSCFLIIFSFLTNFWMVGIMVLLVHDLSDFWLILARLYRDCKFYSKFVLKIIYVIAFIIWVGCRLVVYPLTCVYAGIISLKSGFFDLASTEIISIMTYPIYAMLFMLSMLFILQVFWTYYILQSFVSLNISKKVQHNYD